MTDEHGEVERTEAPSARWAAQAHERGLRPCSTELVASCAIFASVVVLRTLGSGLVTSCSEALKSGIEGVELNSLAAVAPVHLKHGLIRPLCWAIPVLLVPAIVAVVVNVSQVGLRFRPELLRPSLARFSPARRITEIVPRAHAIDSAASLVKYLVLAALGGWWIGCELIQGTLTQRGASGPISSTIGSGVLGVITKLAAALLTLGLLDYLRVWWSHRRRLRMTRAELRSELRESEGDPMIRRRRTQSRADLGVRRRNPAGRCNLVLLGKGQLAVSLRVNGASGATLLAREVGPSTGRLSDGLARRASV